MNNKSQFKVRTIYLCENCESVFIDKMYFIPKCKICNGDLTALDGIQSIINAMLTDKSINIAYSQEQLKEIKSRPYFGWRFDGYKQLHKKENNE